jgi:hypothetical protein
LTQLCIRDDVEMITYMSSGWPALLQALNPEN